MEFILILAILYYVAPLFWLVLPFAVVGYCVWFVFWVIRFMYKKFVLRNEQSQKIPEVIDNYIIKESVPNHGCVNWRFYVDIYDEDDLRPIRKSIFRHRRKYKASIINKDGNNSNFSSF